MLCCAIAALGFAGAWSLHRLRLAGGLMLLATVIAGSGALLWDHAGHASADRSTAANMADGISFCLGNRISAGTQAGTTTITR